MQKKWYVVRGICVLQEKELMRSLSLSLSDSQRREPWTACQDRNRIPLLSDGFRGGRDNFFFSLFSGTWSSGSQLLLEDFAEDKT